MSTETFGQQESGWTDRLRALVLGPAFASAVAQTLKSVLAASAAWWISVSLLQTQMPFLAPWVALLTVHATVYRSLSRGVQTTVASSLGVGLSFLVGTFLGVSLWTYDLALLVALAAARIRSIRDEGVAIATTAIFLLSSGFTDQEALLLDRIIEVCLGVTVGVVVNLLIIPPLRDSQASRYVDSINRRMGEVLVDMADEFSRSWDVDQAQRWMDHTEIMVKETRSAWEFVGFARESHQANPRTYLRRHGVRLSKPAAGSRAEDSYTEILTRVDEGISHLRNLTRTLHQATYAEGPWDDRFRREWTSIARDCGRAIADPDAEVEPVHERLDALSTAISREGGLPSLEWPLYGSLLTSLRHIVVIVDDVASTRATREAHS